MRRATRPIERLTETAEHIAATQDLTTPIPVRGDDEVGRLAASFNTMLIALDTSREQQQRLVVDASHELRTPLTAVRTNIDFLGHATTLDAEQRGAAHRRDPARARRAHQPGERDGRARHRRPQRGAGRAGTAGRGGGRRRGAVPAPDRPRDRGRRRRCRRRRGPPVDARPRRLEPGRQRAEVQPRR